MEGGEREGVLWRVCLTLLRSYQHKLMRLD